MTLKFAQETAQKQGVTLNIGEFPNPIEDDEQDPTRAVRLTAHAIARLADRMPFSRRISRHMEGSEASAGIFSDILSLIAELAKRNPDLVKERLEGFGDELQKARAKRAHEQAVRKTNEQSGVGNAA